MVPETGDTDNEEWISASMLDLKASLRYDRSLQYYEKYIKAPEEQEWKILPARSYPIHCLHPRTGFFFYAAPLETMGIRIPFTPFQR